MNNNVTKELNDIARDFQLSQNKCNEIYTALGKKYFEANRENPSEEYVTMFNELEALLKRQEGMEARRKFLNGIVVCSNCKTDNSVHLSFCASCGTRLPHKNVTIDDGNIRCVNCGNILNPGQAFCGNCGAKAPEPKKAPVEEAAVEVAATTEQPVIDEPKVYSAPEEKPVSTDVTCNMCQTVITNPAAVFCPNCGNKVR